MPNSYSARPTIFKNEDEIRKLGGKVSDTYYTFREIVLSLNANKIPLFIYLGFTGEDLDLVLEAIRKGQSYEKEAFIQNITKKVKDGKIPLEEILSPRTLEEREESPEERAHRMDVEIHRALCFRYKDISKEFYETFRPSFAVGYNGHLIDIFKGCLSLEPSGLNVNVRKFIKIFQSYTKAEESITRKHHQEAADALNRFFNGVKITDDELNRYFSFEYGVAEVKLQSINTEDYSRLGKRKVTITRIDNDTLDDPGETPGTSRHKTENI